MLGKCYVLLTSLLHKILNHRKNECAYCPKYGRWSIIESHSGEAKITDFQFAVCICQDVLGLQISMKNVGCSPRKQEKSGDCIKKKKSSIKLHCQ